MYVEEHTLRYFKMFDCNKRIFSGPLHIILRYVFTICMSETENHDSIMQVFPLRVRFVGIPRVLLLYCIMLL